MALRLGATSIDHLDTITPDEIRAIAAHRAYRRADPAVNFNLGSTHSPARGSRRHPGAAVALATDFNPGSAPCLAPAGHGNRLRYCGLLPAEALNAVTINAVWAVGLVLGSVPLKSESRRICRSLIATIFVNWRTPLAAIRFKALLNGERCTRGNE